MLKKFVLNKVLKNILFYFSFVLQIARYADGTWEKDFSVSHFSPNSGNIVLPEQEIWKY